MQRRKFLGFVSSAMAFSAIAPFEMSAINSGNISAKSTKTNDREIWVRTLFKMANPIFSNLANGTLRKNMPVEKATSYGFECYLPGGCRKV